MKISSGPFVLNSGDPQIETGGFNLFYPDCIEISLVNLLLANRCLYACWASAFQRTAACFAPWFCGSLLMVPVIPRDGRGSLNMGPMLGRHITWCGNFIFSCFTWQLGWWNIVSVPGWKLQWPPVLVTLSAPPQATRQFLTKPGVDTTIPLLAWPLKFKVGMKSPTEKFWL